MIVTFIDYQKLEKIEVGGLEGRWYSPVIENIYAQFTKFMEKMSSISYDPLDLLNEANNASFLEDYNLYLDISNNSDKCLSNICIVYFENNVGLNSLRKVYICWFNYFAIFSLTNDVTLT